MVGVGGGGSVLTQVSSYSSYEDILRKQFSQHVVCVYAQFWVGVEQPLSKSGKSKFQSV